MTDRDIILRKLQEQLGGNRLQWQQAFRVSSLFPTAELYRAMKREHSQDWKTIWRSNGGNLFNDRMVALIDDPIWRNISHFNLPYPPFAVASGMRKRLIARPEAIALGVIKADEVVIQQYEDIQAPEDSILLPHIDKFMTRCEQFEIGEGNIICTRCGSILNETEMDRCRFCYSVLCPKCMIEGCCGNVPATSVNF